MDFLNVFVIYFFSFTFVYSAPTKLCGFPPTVVIESNPLYTKPCETAEKDSPLKNICDRIRNESDCYFPEENKSSFPVDDVVTSIYDEANPASDKASKLDENCRYMIDKRLLTVGDNKCTDICGGDNFYVCDLYVAMDKVLRQYFEQEVGTDGSGYKRLDVFIHTGTYSFLFPYPMKGSLHISTQLQPCSDPNVVENTTISACKMVGIIAVEMVKLGNSFSKHRDDPIQYLRTVHGKWSPCENISTLAESELPKGVEDLKDTAKCQQTCGANINICKILFLGLQSLVEETAPESAGDSLSGPDNTVPDSSNVETPEAIDVDNNNPAVGGEGDVGAEPGDGEGLVGEPDLNNEEKPNDKENNEEINTPDMTPDIKDKDKALPKPDSKSNDKDNIEVDADEQEGDENKANQVEGGEDDKSPLDAKPEDIVPPQDPDIVDTKDNQDPDLTDKGGEGTPHNEQNKVANTPDNNDDDNAPVDKDDGDEADNEDLNKPDDGKGEPLDADADNIDENGGDNGTPDADNNKDKIDDNGGEEINNEEIIDQDNGNNQDENNELEKDKNGPATTPNTTSSDFISSPTEPWSTEEDNLFDDDDDDNDDDGIGFNNVGESPLKPEQTSDGKDFNNEENVNKPNVNYKESESLSGESYEEEEVEGGHFMAYFLVFIVVCVAGYIVFHNKQKIMALVIEGKGPNGGGRRPSSKEYKRLKTEDVMPSLEKSAYSKNYVF